VSCLEKKVREVVKNYILLTPGDRVLIAFSGGPDSVALTEILFRLQKTLPFEIALFHLNHQLRGEEAYRDEQFCITFARERGIPLFVERYNVQMLKNLEKLSLEEAARKARYTLLERQAREWKATRIALGHTLDDQVETIVMNLIRGTGLRGLMGMRVKSGSFIRPLLFIPKSEVLHFLAEERLPFVEDSSNWDPSYLRNRIRLGLFPFLEDLNPRFREAFLRLSLNIHDEIGLQEKQPELPWEKEGEVSRIALASLYSIPEGKRLLAVRRFLLESQGNLWDVTRDHLKSIMHLVERKKGDVLLPGKLKCWIQDEYLYVASRKFLLVDLSLWQFAITLPGKNILRELGLCIEGRIGTNGVEKSEWQVSLDLDRCYPPFFVRNFRPGDRICRGGNVKKVKEIFQESGVFWEWRRRIPFLCDQEKILWIPEIALDERAGVQENSKRILHVTMKKYEE